MKDEDKKNFSNKFKIKDTSTITDSLKCFFIDIRECITYLYVQFIRFRFKVFSV